MHPIIEQDCKHIIEALGGDIEKLARKTVLLTGCGGFLGTYLSSVIAVANKSVLRGRECRLIATDNFMRGRPEWISELAKDPHIEVHAHDVREPLPEAIAAQDIHFIIHAASIASPTFYRKDPIATMDANVNGLRSLLEYARTHKDTIESFLFFSTSEIYGDPQPEHIPTPETYRGNVSSTGPRACYDESKRYGETLAVNFYQQYGVPVKMVRPFNNYGPGLKITDRRVLPDFFRNVFAGENITLLSDGSPSRTFCYISDATTGYFKVLLSQHNGEVFNIGCDTPEVSMRELALRVQNIAKTELARDVEVVFQESNDSKYLTDNPVRRCPVIQKARDMVGYNPVMDIKEGLARTACWYADNTEASDN